MLSHGAMLSNCNGAQILLKNLLSGMNEIKFLSWLPLSHSYEHTVQFAQISLGAITFYNESIEKLLPTLKIAKPHIVRPNSPIICFFAANMNTATEFYIIAGAVGLVQGGIQAISRSFFSSLIPKNKEAQFFGFYNLVGKSAVLIGPLLVSWVAYIFSNPRFGILSLLILFIPGLILLWMVPDKELTQ